MPMPKRKSAKQVAYDYIRSRITTLDLEAAEFLKEEEVAEATGLSRTPVREALLRLEAEKLLQLVPKKGAFVPPLSNREMEDLMEARLLLETFSLEKAMRSSESLAEELAGMLAEQRRLIGEGLDLESFIELDRQFHMAIVKAAGNSVIIGIYDSLRIRQLRMAINVLLRSPSRALRLQEAVGEHEAILEAMSRGDAPAVRAAIEHHCAVTLAAGQGRREL